MAASSRTRRSSPSAAPSSRVPAPPRAAARWTSSNPRCKRPLSDTIPRIGAPGTLDAGDVCEADGHFLIGISARTNEAGAEQLAAHLVELGYRADVVDIRPYHQLLHLKTGIAWLGDGRLLATEDLPRWPALAAYEIVRVPETERYAANALRVNDHVLVAAGYPGDPRGDRIARLSGDPARHVGVPQARRRTELPLPALAITRAL